jgi:hypothetical protein
MCFVGDSRLTISGIGDDDIAMLDGVRIFSVDTGAEVSTFAAPVEYRCPAGRVAREAHICRILDALEPAVCPYRTMPQPMASR